MTRLTELKSAKTLRDVAPLLDFVPKGLSYTLYKLSEEMKYRTFTIPKKTGGERTISAPNPRLALLQSNLARLLLDCLDEIEDAEPYRRSVSHGFHRGRSIVTNAQTHQRRRYVLNLDITDFFGSINFGRIRGFFIKDRHFELDPAVATIIAKIACHQNALPQGAPSSPIISNFVGHILDIRLVRLAKQNGCHYTRYADDLTISTNKKTFPESIAKQKSGIFHEWEIGDALRASIEGAGFKINGAKTRMQIRGSRQEVTGLIVNEKVNIRAEYYRTVRSMCNALFQTGSYFVPDAAIDIDDSITQTTNIAPLEGRLSHIYYVKARRDLDYKIKKEVNFLVPNGFESLYKRFLVYKYFVASEQPVIVTEGKTDIIYLRCAIKALALQFPLLVHEKNGNTFANVRFVAPSYINQKVLNLGEGYGGMKKVIPSYDNLLKPYGYRPLYNPVILVLDNDSGGKKVFDVIKNNLGIEINYSKSDLFFHLKHNLYLVKTPSKSGSQSCMEDLFPSDVHSVLLDGKTFDKDKKHADLDTYGKSIFADKVVRARAKEIDFSNFSPLLNGISASIQHYQNSTHSQQSAMAQQG